MENNSAQAQKQEERFIRKIRQWSIMYLHICVLQLGPGGTPEILERSESPKSFALESTLLKLPLKYVCDESRSGN